ncbi:MAG TPA: MFS transporter, partial [Halobacteriales archaeon]|nr:MFS transporter [Halobacteriales archaeon]
VFQFVGGDLADRWGHHRVLLLVSAASVPPLVALPFVRGLPAIAAVAALFGVRAAVGSVSNSYVVRILPESVRGTAWGLVRSLFFVVGATGSAAVGAMADRALFDEAFFLLAGITAVGALLYLWLPPREAVA